MLKYQNINIIIQMAKNINKNQGGKGVKNVLDEQNEPCIKAIQKKIRNINKKISDINELSNKGNLKPEQIEKINKRQKVQEEKAKYEEFLGFYRQIVTENSQMYKTFKFSEVTDLAKAISLASYNHPDSQNQRLNNLVSILNRPSSPTITLQQRFNQVIQALQSYSENHHLKNFVQENFKKHQNQPISNQKLSPKKEEEKVEKKQEKKQEIIFQKKEVQVKPPVKIQTELKVEKEVSPNVVVEAQRKIEGTQKQAQVEEKNKINLNISGTVQLEEKTQEKKPRQYQKYPKRQYKDHEKKKYKPKYQQANQPNQEKRQLEDEKEESPEEEILRDFKREEVRKLHEDGFIVVGKPKLKAKGNDQRQYHQHTHGNKNHHHHKPN